MYYSAIGLLAAMILLIENGDILFRFRSEYDMRAWKDYRRFLLAVLVYYITDILWGVIESMKLSRMLFIDTSVYFVAMAAGLLLWTIYAVNYLGEDNILGKILVYAGRVIAAFVSLLTVVNIFVPVLFTVDSDCAYHALGTRYLILFAQILLFLVISVYAVSYGIKLRGSSGISSTAGLMKRYRTLAVFGLIMATFLFMQLWFPYLPLYAIAYMLGISMLRAFIIREEREEKAVELKEAEKIVELKESITALMDNLPGLSFSKDTKTGVYLACNQAFAEYAHKKTPDGVVGLTDAEIFDAETAAHFVEDDKMALSMDEPYIFFEDVPDAAGNQRQFQTTKLKFIDGLGRLCLLGLCQDVTDVVRIQREYATTKEAYEKAKSTAIIYTHIAQTLARGYEDLYYVDIGTGDYIEYRTDKETGSLEELRRGEKFFDRCKVEAPLNLHPDDCEALLKALDRDTLIDTLEDRSKPFVMTYRLMQDKGPVYVSMRVSRMEDDDDHIIIAITDIDEQMKHRRAAERLMEERTAYARLNALAGDFICVYIVVPETGRYREYSATSGYEKFSLPKEGMDFFRIAREHIRDIIYPDDLERFLTLFTREGVMSEIARSGIFSMSYRLVVEGRPLHVRLKAALIEEKDGARLIVGVNDIDSHVRQEEEYEKRLQQAQSKANIDALTGVKNRHAYLDAEERLDRRILEHRQSQFAVVILDVNDLKKVNDTEGHHAGDQYLRDACRIICGIFKHSPVYRVGGDEFAVIAQDDDYDHIEELIGKMNDHNAMASKSGGIVIACGMSKFGNDSCVAEVFDRADEIMYNNKSKLKEARQ